MDYLEAFVNDCQLRGVKPQSIATYRVFLIPFIEFTKTYEPQRAMFEYLQRYVNDRTKKTALTHIKVYVSWCARQGLCDNWAADIRFRFAAAPQTPVLGIEDLKKVLATTPNTWIGRRDRALYSTLFYTGARRDAVRKMKRSDVNIADRLIFIRTKGDKEMYLTLPRDAALTLNSWLAYSAKAGSLWVFPSSRILTKPIDSGYVTHALPKYALAAGFARRIHVHLLRHSFATLLYKEGTSLDVIQAALGHANITTTAAYVRRLGDASRVRDAVDGVFN